MSGKPHIPRPQHIIKRYSVINKRKLSDEEKRGIKIAYDDIQLWIDECNIKLELH